MESKLEILYQQFEEMKKVLYITQEENKTLNFKVEKQDQQIINLNNKIDFLLATIDLETVSKKKSLDIDGDIIIRSILENCLKVYHDFLDKIKKDEISKLLKDFIEYINKKLYQIDKYKIGSDLDKLYVAKFIFIASNLEQCKDVIDRNIYLKRYIDKQRAEMFIFARNIKHEDTKWFIELLTV